MANDGRKPGRDLILIGGSAGAIEALLKIVAALPRNFEASLLVTIHTSAESPSVLPRMLQRASMLRATHPRDGERLECGCIYVAPPDHHLALGRGNTISVRKGPRENGHRPAIDTLFRSAALHGYGPRSVGVILSGFLDDGSAGLYAIRSRGGVTVVQDPGDAIAADMPGNALQYGNADYILPASQIGEKLIELAGQASKVLTMKKKADKKTAAVKNGNGKSKRELEVAPNEHVSYPEESVGRPSVFACPECHGVLWEISEGGAVRYRCRVGHAYSEVTLNEELSVAAESALWAAMRALDEKASMSRRMADAATGPQRWAMRLREQANTYASHAEMLRRMILGEPLPGEPRVEINDKEKPA